MYWHIISFLLLLVTSSSNKELISPTLVEICDNALDDDEDGKIDLNDDDCDCLPLKPESLIPNASFEEQNCCPTLDYDVTCATFWLRASSATSDYYHACNEVTFANVPQPIPDGEGCVGFINGVFNGDNNPDWKEYVGACLTDTLFADSIYRFQFHVGFASRRTSPEIEVAIFGTTDCANLPFGGEDTSFGCPTNSSEWTRLGTTSVIGENEWKLYTFTVQPRFNITAVAIGPSCAHLSMSNNPYHYLDNLILAKEIEFEVDIEVIGEPCDEDLVFRIAERENTNYQWYKDGVAIVGATDAVLNRPQGNGKYQIRLLNENGCKLSEPYTYRKPSKFVPVTATVCENSVYIFGDQKLRNEGVYLDTLKTVSNCDSVVRLDLRLATEKTTYITAKIFPKEQYQLGIFNISVPGNYEKIVPSSSGCDSTVYLELSHYSIYIPNTFSPNDDGINDQFAIVGGPDLQLVASLQIFDRWGNLAYQKENLEMAEGWNGEVNGKAVIEGMYVYAAEVIMDDGKKRQMKGMFSLIR